MITAPGAPLAGLPAPFSTPPKPSPSHQTASAQPIEAPSANLIVGRQAMPSAIASWMTAKAASVAAPWSATILADQVIGSAMTAGFPGAVPASIWANPLLNMKDWNCSTASSSHRPASQSWSRRRAVRGGPGGLGRSGGTVPGKGTGRCP
jgi:hypothetical protein